MNVNEKHLDMSKFYNQSEVKVQGDDADLFHLDDPDEIEL